MQIKNLMILLGFVASYLVMTFSIPPDPAALDKYDITSSQARLLGLTITIPIILIWGAAFYGYDRFKRYAASIRQDRDGQALDSIANGLMVLALGLPISSLTSTALSYASRTNEGLIPTAVIVNNYVSMLVALVAFAYILRGAKALAEVTGRKFLVKNRRMYDAVYVALAAAYSYAVLNSDYKTEPAPGTNQASYYLPDWLIVTTLLVPYLAAWYAGLLANAQLGFYRRNVKGTLYKSALGYLVAGIMTVVITSVIIQLFSLFGAEIADLSLGALLVVIYALIAVIAAGYLFIAMGAKRLNKLEEVV